MIKIVPNSVDPDQRPQKAASNVDFNYLHEEQIFYFKYLDRQARANSIDPDQIGSDVLTGRTLFQANSEDPSQTSTEYDVSYEDRQLRANKTPAVYPICSK